MTAHLTTNQRLLDGARAALSRIDAAPLAHRTILLGFICDTIRETAASMPHVLVEMLPHVARLGAPQAAYDAYCACKHRCSYGEQASILVGIVPYLQPSDAVFDRALQDAREFPISFARPALLAGLACGIAEPEQGSLVNEALSRARAESDAAEQAVALAYTLPYLPEIWRGPIAREASDRLSAWDLAADQADEVRAFIAPYLAAPSQAVRI
jgi:hypothetical protein